MRTSLRLPVAILAALAVAEAGVLLLRPASRGPEPETVQARAYFSEQAIRKAEAFRTGQTWLHGSTLTVELAALALLLRRPPRFGRLAQRPVLAGAATGAIVSLAVGLLPLPIRAVSRERAKDVGLVTQDWTGWLGDVAKSEAIGAGIAAGGGAMLVLVLRRFGSRWWVPGSAVVVAFGAATTMLWPVLVEPRFNRFDPLPAGPLRTDVLRLAERSGVEVGEVYVMDASRRTTAANAYVAGLGRTKRVVLYDNLLHDFTDAEVRSVVAHELGHVKYQDLPKGLLYLALVAPVGLLAAALLAQRLGASADAPEKSVPAVALALAVLVPAVTSVSNQLSRAVERRADEHALEITGEPRALIGLQTRLALQNVSDPDPPRAVHTLLGTHPTALQRIGLAEAYERLTGPVRLRTPGGS